VEEQQETERTDLIMSQLLRFRNEDSTADFTLGVGKQVAVLLYHLIYCRVGVGVGVGGERIPKDFKSGNILGK